MLEAMHAADLEAARLHLTEALRDLSDQCSQLAGFLAMPALTQEQARQAQMPVQGAARQATAFLQDYLRALELYTERLPEQAFSA